MKKHLIILCLLLGLVGSRASAYDFEVDGIYYNIISASEMTCQVTSGDVTYSGNIEIPATISYNNRAVSVIRISESAFNGCTGLTRVTIGNSVKSIEGGTFAGCSSLRSVTIGNSVTSIGSQAFYDCHDLTSINIPNSVTSIGSQAFYDCVVLTSINIPSSVKSIGSDAFWNCLSLETVHITDLEAWCKISFDDEMANPVCASNSFGGKATEL